MIEYYITNKSMASFIILAIFAQQFRIYTPLEYKGSNSMFLVKVINDLAIGVLCKTYDNGNKIGFVSRL